MKETRKTKEKSLKLTTLAFTLIELLAVIVILAIIALIAVPIILNLIDNTKDSSVVRSGELYLDTVEQAVARKNLNDNFNPSVCNIQEDGNLICEGTELKVETKGSRPSSGIIIFDSGKITKVENMVLDNYELETNKEGKLVIKVRIKPKGTYLMKGNIENEDSTFFNGPLKKNQIESIKIEDTKEVPENVLGSWDVSALQDKSVMAWYTDADNNGLYELYIGGEGGVKANPDSKSLFYNFTNAKTIDLKNLDTSNVLDMQHMFQSCSNLTELDLSSFDTSKVTNMTYMFNSCESLVELDLSNFDTSNVTNMASIFSGCKRLIKLDLSSFDTSNVTRMDTMFMYCYNLVELDLSSFNTSKVTNMINMFNGCGSLAELDLSSFDTSNVVNMSSMFDGCGSLAGLDLSSFDTSNVTDMMFMFNNCKSLIELDLSNFETSNVTKVNYMFQNDKNLTTIMVKNNTVKSFTNSRLNDNKITGVNIIVSS